MSEKKTHSGGCHCGAVRFTVDADFSSAMACNCSMCEKAGSLLVFVPVADFTLLSGEDVLKDYQFNTKKIHHLFCSECGIKPFGRGKNSKGEEMIAVNVRCIDDINLDDVEVKTFNGRDL